MSSSINETHDDISEFIHFTFEFAAQTASIYKYWLILYTCLFELLQISIIPFAIINILFIYTLIKTHKDERNVCLNYYF